MTPRHRIPPSPGPGRLAARQFAADPWVSAGLAVLVGLVALLLTVVPRSMADVQSRQLVTEVDSLSAAQRDVLGEWTRRVMVGSWDGLLGEDAEPVDTWATFREAAERIRADQPEPLRGVLGDPQFLARVQADLDDVPALESGYYAATYSAAVDPDLAEHVDLVRGDWPELRFIDLAGYDIAGQPRDGDTETVPVLLLEQAAQELLLEVGDVFADQLELAGTYEPKDPDDPRWQHVDNGATMGTLFDPNQGVAALATVFLAPGNRGTLGPAGTAQMRLWYPVDTGSVVGTEEVTTLRTQLTGMLAQDYVVATPAEEPDAQGDQVPSFRTGLTDTLDRVASQQRATTSMLAVVVAGPLGVAVAVAALGARLVVHRRQDALALTLARGASPVQLRRLVAAEGLLLSVPAAALGSLAATFLVPGPTPWWQWLVTAAVALLPPVALAASVDDASLLRRRADLTGRSTSRWRWLVEVAVVGLAAVATWRLLDRGTRGDDAAESGVDLLAAATPVLLALAACVVALRIYPFPLAALTSALRGRRGLTPFLGAARSLRDPAGGLVPALAVVLGTTIALVSAVLLSTVTRGAEVAAWEGNGAGVRVTGPPLTEELRAQLEELPGVQAVAGVPDAGVTATLTVGTSRTSLRVWVADPELEEVYAGSPHLDVPAAALWAGGGDGAPAVVALRGATDNLPEDADAVDDAVAATLSGVGDVEIVQALPELPGVVVTGPGVLVGREQWEAGGNTVPFARTILLGLSGDVAPQDVAESVVEAIDGAGVVSTTAGRLERFEQAPVTTGLRQVFLGATVVSGLLTVLAVVVVQLIGSGARTRLLAVLRTLGMGPRQARALTAWELGPLLVTSTVVGTLLGLAVPWVLLRGLDLRGLTGGTAQPILHLDLPLLALVLGAVVATVLIAVTASAWLAGRTNLAQALRVGEER